MTKYPRGYQLMGTAKRLYKSLCPHSPQLPPHHLELFVHLAPLT